MPTSSTPPEEDVRAAVDHIFTGLKIHAGLTPEKSDVVLDGALAKQSLIYALALFIEASSDNETKQQLRLACDEVANRLKYHALPLREWSRANGRPAIETFGIVMLPPTGSKPQ